MSGQGALNSGLERPECDYLMHLLAEFPALSESSRSQIYRRINLLYTMASDSEDWTPTALPEPLPSTSFADEDEQQPKQQGGGDCSRFAKIQRNVGQFLRRALSFLPEEYRGELWIYAAGYVFLYTVFMLFYMSTFGFICIMIYNTLMTLLVLRYCGIGPLVSQPRRSFTDGACVQITEQAAQFLQPETRLCLGWQNELWVYAAGFVYSYTVTMFINISTFGLICTMVYSSLVSMLTLMYFQIGPLASQKTSKTTTCKTT